MLHTALTARSIKRRSGAQSDVRGRKTKPAMSRLPTKPREVSASPVGVISHRWHAQGNPIPERHDI